MILVQLVPTLYTTLRVFFLGQLPGEYSFSIAGQLTWVNLLYEIINESIILPLYYFMGKASKNEKELNNCFKSGLLVTFGIYVLLTKDTISDIITVYITKTKLLKGCKK